MSTPQPARRRRLRLSLSDERIKGLLWQIVVVGIAVAVVGWLWSNAIHNLSARRISTGFAFLGREAGMPIADSWLAYSPKDPYVRAFIVGIVYSAEYFWSAGAIFLAALAAMAFPEWNGYILGPVMGLGLFVPGLRAELRVRRMAREEPVGPSA